MATIQTQDYYGSVMESYLDDDERSQKSPVSPDKTKNMEEQLTAQMKRNLNLNDKQSSDVPTLTDNPPTQNYNDIQQARAPSDQINFHHQLKSPLSSQYPQHQADYNYHQNFPQDYQQEEGVLYGTSDEGQYHYHTQYQQPEFAYETDPQHPQQLGYSSSASELYQPNTSAYYNSHSNFSTTSAPADFTPFSSPPSTISLSSTATLPSNITLDETIEHHRQSAKRSPDPSVQLEFARYLVEVADAAAQTEISPKTAKKKREALLHEGLKLVKKLASTGTGVGKSQPYPEAMVFLAECYGNGTLGLNIDHDKAFHLYLQASKLNHPSATYRVGVCYDVGAGTKRDSARAREFYRKAAALGDPPAMYKFGLILLNGLLGCPQNPREAITWLKRAAAVSDESNPHALHELGLIYEKPGVPSVIPDEAYARELFTQAAQLGYAPSQYKMGLCYEHGTLTCANDPARSLAWYSRAAEQGHPEAELALSGWYLTGCEGILRQSDEQAYAWARKAADKGLSKAEYAVGYYSEMGIGVPQSLDEARRWYQRAAAQGNRKAMQRLQELKKYGKALRNEKPIRNGNDSDCVIM